MGPSLYPPLRCSHCVLYLSACEFFISHFVQYRWALHSLVLDGGCILMFQRLRKRSSFVSSFSMLHSGIGTLLR